MFMLIGANLIIPFIGKIVSYADLGLYYFITDVIFFQLIPKLSFILLGAGFVHF